MKITKSQLKQIIKEELRKTINESYWSSDMDHQRNVDSYEEQRKLERAIKALRSGDEDLLWAFQQARAGSSGPSITLKAKQWLYLMLQHASPAEVSRALSDSTEHAEIFGSLWRSRFVGPKVRRRPGEECDAHTSHPMYLQYCPEAMERYRKLAEVIFQVAQQKSDPADSLNEKEDDSFSKAGEEIEKKGTEGVFTAKAKKAGMGVQAYAKQVLAKDSKASTKTKRQASFAKGAATVAKKRKGKKKK